MKKKVMFLVLSSMMICSSIFAQENTQETKSTKVQEIGFVFSNLNSFGLRYKVGNENTMFRITSLVLNGTNSQTDYNSYSSNGTTSSSLPQNSSNSLGAGLNFGFEKRKAINNNLSFYYGIDVLTSYTYSKTNTSTPNYISTNYYDTTNTWKTIQSLVNNSSSNTSWTVSAGLGFVVGASYKLTNSITIGAEIETSVKYNYTKSTNSSNSPEYNTNYPLYQNNQNMTSPPVIVNNLSNQSTTTNSITYGFTNSSAAVTLAFKF